MPHCVRASSARFATTSACSALQPSRDKCSLELLEDRAGPRDEETMRRLLLVLGTLGFAAVGLGTYACSSDTVMPPADSGPVDTGFDSPVAYEGTCVKSPDPA